MTDIRILIAILVVILIVVLYIAAAVRITLGRMSNMRQEIRDELEALANELKETDTAVDSALLLITRQSEQIKEIADSGADVDEIKARLAAFVAESDAAGTRLANAVVAGTPADGASEPLEEPPLPAIDPGPAAGDGSGDAAGAGAGAGSGDGSGGADQGAGDAAGQGGAGGGAGGQGGEGQE